MREVFLSVFTLINGIVISITRMCLARFEKDNIEEAQVVCRTGAGANPEDHQGSRNLLPEKLPGSTKDGTYGIKDNPSRSRTWQLPPWINFSYSTVPRRIRPPEQRQPNPFGPRARTFSRLQSVDENNSTASIQEQPFGNMVCGSLNFPSAGDLCQPPACNSTSLVQRHLPVATWDDEPRHNIPYDNPYYTKPITNALWLPRDPLGLLDLDDTVDVYRALTTEPGAGDLGRWFGPGSSTSPVSQLPSSLPSEEHPSIAISRKYNGSEDIDLPEGIKSRANAIHREDDMESTRPRRPSLFSRNRSGSSGSAISSDNRTFRGLPRSQTMDGGLPKFPFPRKSSSSESVPRSRERAYSYLPPPNLHFQSQFHGVDPGSRPDLHAQAEFVRSTASIMHGGSRVSLPPSNVTTREAVVTEAIAEEQLATEERLRKEHADAQLNHGSTRRSWLMSWIYTKIQ